MTLEQWSRIRYWTQRKGCQCSPSPDWVVSRPRTKEGGGGVWGSHMTTIRRFTKGWLTAEKLVVCQAVPTCSHFFVRWTSSFLLVYWFSYLFAFADVERNMNILNLRENNSSQLSWKETNNVGNAWQSKFCQHQTNDLNLTSSKAFFCSAKTIFTKPIVFLFTWAQNAYLFTCVGNCLNLFRIAATACHSCCTVCGSHRLLMTGCTISLEGHCEKSGKKFSIDLLWITCLKQGG